jgi:hypothetical protein
MSCLTKLFDSDTVLEYRDTGRLVRKRVPRAQSGKDRATAHDRCGASATHRTDKEAYRRSLQITGGILLQRPPPRSQALCPR